jgi:hypothetical protein
MRKGMLIMMLTLTFTLTVAPTMQSHAIIWVVVKAVLKKVMMAMDLAIQRAQNETIKLQNAQKVIENELSKLKLNEIADWADKTKTLYQNYFDELWKVKDVLTYYKRVKEVLASQLEMVDEYKRAYNIMQNDKNFSSEELKYIYQVYEGILEESVENINQISMVINAFTTQMSDVSRLAIINKAADKIESNTAAIRKFTNQNILLSLQRTKSVEDMKILRKLYDLQGINN